MNGRISQNNFNITIHYLLALVSLVGMVLVACGGQAEPTATATAPPSATPQPAGNTPVSLPDTNTPTLTDTPSATPTLTETPTITPIATATLTATPGPNAVEPTLGSYVSTPFTPPPTAIPTPVARLPFGEDVVNVLLVGTDSALGGEYRTDTIIVVSVDKSNGVVTMLSIPRDLYVYVPSNTMGTINTAVSINRYAPDGPIALLQQTILYNLGIPTHYYAVVDIENFISIVDTLGGVDVPVLCEFSDTLLIAPDLDPWDRRNYVEFYLPPGIHHLDGTDAMWYARLRKTTDDQDRSRRQQDVLRAIFNQALSLNLVAQAPTLYSEHIDKVETNMGLGDVLQFVSIIDNIKPENIRSFSIRSPYIFHWDGAADKYPSAQLPNGEDDKFANYIARVFAPIDSNRLAEESFTVEIINRAGNPDNALLAAYALRSIGLAAVIGEDQPVTEQTSIIDYTTTDKGSPLPDILRLLYLDESRVSDQPNPERTVDFQLSLGTDYASCPLLNTAYYPITRPTPTPAP